MPSRPPTMATRCREALTAVQDAGGGSASIRELAGRPAEIQGDRDVRPAAPASASQLMLIVYDVDDTGDHVERGRTTLALS